MTKMSKYTATFAKTTEIVTNTKNGVKGQKIQ